MAATRLAYEALVTAIETLLSDARPTELAEATRRLSERYRAPRPAGLSSRGPSTKVAGIDAQAYVAGRLPATFTAISYALEAAVELAPDFAPASLLDLGAGTGAAAWAATAVFPSLTQIDLVDRDQGMMDLGRRLRDADPRRTATPWSWHRGDLSSAALPAADLVTASYTLSELDPQRAVAAARAAWAATQVAAAMVENSGSGSKYAPIYTRTTGD